MRTLHDTHPGTFETVLLRVADRAGREPAALFRLARSCPAYAAILRSDGEDAPWWRRAWERFLGAQTGARLLEGPEAPPASVGAREKLRLCCATGCLRCGAPRVRKVYWEFRTRLCGGCLTALTVRDYEFPASRVSELEGLPSRRVDVYQNRYLLFMRADVTRRLGAEAVEAVDAARAAREERARRALEAAEAVRARWEAERAQREAERARAEAERREARQTRCQTRCQTRREPSAATLEALFEAKVGAAVAERLRDAFRAAREAPANDSEDPANDSGLVRCLIRCPFPNCGAARCAAGIADHCRDAHVRRGHAL